MSTEMKIEERAKKINARVKLLIKKADQVLENAAKELEDARLIVEPAGLTVESSILDLTFGFDVTVLKTTGGYSNTDHVVKITGDPRKDRIEELKRAYQRRIRSSQPEARGEDRWDKPKIPGERRRRILREKDMPQAPPEPPISGYILFLSQMTTKIRHDRPNQHHNQSKVIQEIVKIWKTGMTDADRDYYNAFAREAREEYERLHQEYRATGRYQPSGKFEKLQGIGPWVRANPEEKNGLERELSTYDTVLFPPRPKELDEAYEQRKMEGIKRRKLMNKEATAKKTAERGKSQGSNTDDASGTDTNTGEEEEAGTANYSTYSADPSVAASDDDNENPLQVSKNAYRNDEYNEEARTTGSTFASASDNDDGLHTRNGGGDDTFHFDNHNNDGSLSQRMGGVTTTSECCEETEMVENNYDGVEMYAVDRDEDCRPSGFIEL